ncbi:hypothetical protein [Nocardioides sp. NPDC047086]|uniref:hypothetical protein n=1 Tax=Nocardioides sp. NPDC047086 TaxID=3154810 RepID=UPI0033EFF779
MTWQMVGVIVAAVSVLSGTVFGCAVWIKHLIDANGKGSEGEIKRVDQRIDAVSKGPEIELKRVEQKVDMVLTSTRDNHENFMKVIDAKFEVVQNQLERLRSDFLFYGESMDAQRVALAEIRDRLDKLL